MMASTQPAAQACDPFAASRAYPRVEVALPAFLQANGDRHPVQILDLSAGGAKLNCPAGLPAGTAVTLDCGTLSRAAVVRWHSSGQLGVSFDHELEVRDVAALSERSKALAALRRARE
jgi:hypothetical protein